MKPSKQILEHNLRRLLARCYEPARPSQEFVQRLEGELAPWLRPRSQARSRARRASPVWIGSLAAASLLLMWFVLEGTGAREPAELGVGPESQLALGQVAVRELDHEWRAATAVELEQGIAWSARALGVATPDACAALLVDGDSWGVQLELNTRLFVRPGEAGLRFRLESGGARAFTSSASRRFVAPTVFHWDGLAFRSAAELLARASGDPGADRESLELGLDERDAEPPATPVVEEAGAKIRGRAKDAASADALTSFSVSLLESVPLPDVSDPRTTHFESATGEFELSGLDPGSYSLYLQGEDHALWKHLNFELQAGAVLELEALCEAGVSVRGYVVDRESGAAIAGALIVAEQDTPLQVVSLDSEEIPPEVRAFTHSAADGSFLLEHLNAGPQRLRANGAEHAASWTSDLVLAPGGGRDDVMLELGPGGGVHGLVQREDGEPFENARVIISRFDAASGAGRMTYRGVWTDAQGRYIAEHLAPGFYVVLQFGDVVSEDDYGDPEYSSVQILEEQLVEVNFLGGAATASVHGVVRDADGAPLAGVNVQLYRGGASFRAVLSDESGAYSVDLEAAGKCAIYAGSGDSCVRVAELRVSQGEALQHDFVLDGKTLRARVRDAESAELLSTVSLSLLPSKASSRTRLASFDQLIGRTWRGVDGEYSMQHVAPGDYDLLVMTESGEGAATLVEDIHVPETGELPLIELELERAGFLRLEVVDELGQALEGARVQLVHPFGRRWRFDHQTETNLSGALALRGMLPGTWSVSVRAAGFESTQLEVVIDAGVERVRRVVLRAR